jgi:hypothetical protein
LALGQIKQIKVEPREVGARVTVRRESDVGVLTTSISGKEVKTLLRDVEMKQEKLERDIKLFRQRHYPELVTWSPIDEPVG